MEPPGIKAVVCLSCNKHIKGLHRGNLFVFYNHTLLEYTCGTLMFKKNLEHFLKRWWFHTKIYVIFIKMVHMKHCLVKGYVTVI